MPYEFDKKIQSDKKQKQITLASFGKRKLLNAGKSDASRAPVDQMVPGAKHSSTSSFHFDFSKDPQLIAAQRRILNAMKAERASESRIAGTPKFSFSSNSNGEFFSEDGFLASETRRKATDRRADVSPTPLPDFRMASGRPLVKEVLPVAPAEDESVAEKIPARERNLNKRRLGNVGGQFRAPKLGPTSTSAESEDGCLLKRKPSEKSRMHDELEEKRRDGWKGDPSLKHFEENIVDLIESEIMCKKEVTGWADVAGLDGAKKALKEIIILPFLRPDIFKGIRAPPKGVLLFGPPGTGKTMIGRCVASQCKATFFNIAASSLTSKWVGEGEKLVRVLFAVARVLQPSIIFIDEIDSLLTSRSEGEHESSRRIKTEFLIHLDGVATSSEERILVLGATNRPQELDDAAKRRFAKRLYIALPSLEARKEMVRSLLSGQRNDLSDADVMKIGELTEGYSGADMKQLCAEASMGPVREIIESSSLDIATVDIEQVRPIALKDFTESVRVVRPTVIEKDLIGYREWDKKFGSLAHLCD